MKIRRNLVIVFVLALLLAVAVYQNQTREQVEALPKEEAPVKGFLAPSFRLEGLDGKTYAVEGKREKALLINFWASWCGPCHQEAPDLVKFYETYGDRLDIYAVNVTTLDTMKGVEDFVDRYDISFPVLLDKKNKVTDLYKAYGYPTNVLVDRDGVVREVFIGIRPPAQMENAIRRVLK